MTYSQTYEESHEIYRQKLLSHNPKLQKMVAELNENGYLMIPNLVPKSEMRKIKEEADKLLANAKVEELNKVNYPRKIVYSAVCKTRIFDQIILNKVLTDVLDYYLYKNYLLSISIIIQLLKTKTHQPIHRDSQPYVYSDIYNSINPLKITMLLAIDDFTSDNGSTLIIPKSHLWNKERKINFKSDNIIKAIMPAGSVIIYFGNLFHAGGHNITNNSRKAFIMGFTQPWIRPQENIMFEYPIKKLNELPKKIKNMIGYSLHTKIGRHGIINGMHPIEYVKRLAKL